MCSALLGSGSQVSARRSWRLCMSLDSTLYYRYVYVNLKAKGIICTYMQAYVHTAIHTCIHTYIHTYIRTHTCLCYYFRYCDSYYYCDCDLLVLSEDQDACKVLTVL